MKAGRLHTAWIMARSGWATFCVCVHGIVLGWMGRLSRETADHYARRWSKKLLSILKVDFKVVGLDHFRIEPNQSYLVMVNHASLYDIPISFYALPCSLRMVSKKELFKIPVFGQALRAGEIQSIDRQNRRQAIKDLKTVQEKMESGLVIWMAPEGTRSKDGRLQPLKKGAFVMAIQAQAKIIPVGIRGARDLLPKKTWQFHLNQPVEVHVGEPIDTAEYSLENKEVLMDKVASELKRLKGES